MREGGGHSAGARRKGNIEDWVRGDREEETREGFWGRGRVLRAKRGGGWNLGEKVGIQGTCLGKLLVATWTI